MVVGSGPRPVDPCGRLRHDVPAGHVCRSLALWSLSELPHRALRACPCRRVRAAGVSAGVM